MINDLDGFSTIKLPTIRNEVHDTNFLMISRKSYHSKKGNYAEMTFSSKIESFIVRGVLKKAPLNGSKMLLSLNWQKCID